MFGQPWAWLGLLGVAWPVAAHLLSRHQADRVAFPSLRFIEANALSAVRRHRISDRALLAVRALIMTAACAALAGPLWSASTGDRGVSRAIVVDTSAGAVGDAGPAAARRIAADSAASVIVEAGSLPAGMAAASAWLATVRGLRELVIVSDFATGTLDATAVAGLPAGVGVRFETLPHVVPKSLDGFSTDGTVARMTWPAPRHDAPLPLTIDGGAEQAKADAMLAAVASLVVTSPVDGTARRARVLLSSAPDFARRRADPAPLTQPWMFDAVRPILADPAWSARTVATADEDGLVLLVDDVAGGEAASAITARVLAALLQPLPWGEFEPDVIPPATLAAWTRAPGADADAGEPQGRWLWGLVLALLAVEVGVRRRVA